MLWVAEVFLLATTLVAAQDPNLEKNGDSAPYFDCPETSGKFADNELCDKFYICRKGVATIEFCPEGLLFDTTIVNHEKCVFPHKVDCGDRNRVQITSPDIDNRCKNANGIFDWSRAGEEVGVCDKYIQCDDGRAFEFPCAGGLVLRRSRGEVPGSGGRLFLSCGRENRPTRTEAGSSNLPPRYRVSIILRLL